MTEFRNEDFAADDSDQTNDSNAAAPSAEAAEPKRGRGSGAQPPLHPLGEPLSGEPLVGIVLVEDRSHSSRCTRSVAHQRWPNDLVATQPGSQKVWRDPTGSTYLGAGPDGRKGCSCQPSSKPASGKPKIKVFAAACGSMAASWWAPTANQRAKAGCHHRLPSPRFSPSLLNCKANADGGCHHKSQSTCGSKCRRPASSVQRSSQTPLRCSLSAARDLPAKIPWASVKTRSLSSGGLGNPAGRTTPPRECRDIEATARCSQFSVQNFRQLAAM